MNEMPRNLGKNLLIAMGNSPASLRLVQIVADSVPDLAETQITLMHYLAPVYWEHGGIDTRKDLTALHAEEDEVWQEERAEQITARRYFEEGRSILVAAGIPQEHIHTKYAYEENDVTEAVLDALKAGHYSAVIVGKHHHDYLERALAFSFTAIMHRHVADVVVWVVDDEQPPSESSRPIK
jgi:hypothetical protein